MPSATNSVQLRDLQAGLLAAGAAVAAVVVENLGTLTTVGTGRTVAAIALAATSGAAVAAARSRPLAAGVVCAAAYQAVTVTVYGSVLVMIIASCVIGLCATRTTRRATLVLSGACAAFAIAALVAVAGDWPIRVGDVVAAVALAVIPVAIGDAFRNRQELAEDAIERARRLEQVRELEMARAVDDERLRIARDVHDIVGHHLSAISIHAGVGHQRLAAGDQPAAKEALGTIRRLSSTALAETRRSLRLVRSPPNAPLAPVPALSTIDTLVQTARSGGIEVTLERTGAPQPLPELVETCAYRVVQEALTNVLRHSAAKRAGVSIAYQPERIEVRVSDDGIGPRRPDAFAGHGLAGMRERVDAVGGTVAAGPRAVGGWEVVARLPLEVARS